MKYIWDLFHWVIFTRYAFVPALLVAMLVWAMHAAFADYAFRAKMKKLGLTPRFRFKRFRGDHRAANRRIGAVAFARRYHETLLLISIFVLLLGVIRSVFLADATEIARSGGLVTILALFSALVGFREAKALRQGWAKITSASSKVAVADFGQANIDRPLDEANKRAQFVAIALATIGSFVWAYGDQIIGCELFSRLDVKYASSCVNWNGSHEPEIFN
ncbi:hypothetical protein [Rhizobium ruizarguesonis]|uniref:hypothetical protein n=1 Tax=Rhizobium ruizarguesonis TaxID=2081791 RepID=UPI0013DE844F|nr:hypothetical protein [Rhizobium ruizarguesonis]NEJ94316.1 hypothetical protein [Rhizobium ruizarguesonis]